MKILVPFGAGDGDGRVMTLLEASLWRFLANAVGRVRSSWPVWLYGRGQADAGAAAPDGGGKSRWRPRFLMQRRSKVAGPWPGAVWVATWGCAGSKFSSARLVRLRAMRSLNWLLHRGGGPGVGGVGWRPGAARAASFRRPVWFVFGQCEGRTGCYVGAAAPKTVACVCCVGVLASCGRRDPRLCGFRAVFLINRAMYSLYGFWTRFPL
jgi:hypothetical protein